MSNQQTKVHEFSLVKAQKYLDKLRSSIKSSSDSTSFGNPRKRTTTISSMTRQVETSVTLGQLTLLYNDEYKALETFDKALQNSRNETMSRLNILRDLKNLKEQVYSKNSEIGLSAILTQIDLLTEERKIYDDTKISCQHITYTR